MIKTDNILLQYIHDLLSLRGWSRQNGFQESREGVPAFFWKQKHLRECNAKYSVHTINAGNPSHLLTLPCFKWPVPVLSIKWATLQFDTKPTSHHHCFRNSHQLCTCNCNNRGFGKTCFWKGDPTGEVYNLKGVLKLWWLFPKKPAGSTGTGVRSILAPFLLLFTQKMAQDWTDPSETCILEGSIQSWAIFYVNNSKNGARIERTPPRLRGYPNPSYLIMVQWYAHLSPLFGDGPTPDGHIAITRLFTPPVV